MNIYDDYDEQSYQFCFPSELENLETINCNCNNSVNQSHIELYFNNYNIMKNSSIGNNSIENNSSILKINSIGNNSIENINNNMLKNSLIEKNNINNIVKINSIENNKIGNKLIENIIFENKKKILKINSIGNNSIEKISIENKSMENNSIKKISIENKSMENNSIEKNKNHEKSQFLNKKRHNKYSTDNIFRRINVHYLKFLIIFLNEILKILKIKGEFKDINYSFKRNLNKTKFSQIKKESLIYFLKLENNNKYKNKDLNKTLYNQIEHNCKAKLILNKLMSKSFIEIFKNIYIKNKKVIIFEGLTLHIHNNFDDFLENEDVKGDDLYKKKILEVVKKSYLEYIFDIQRYSSPQ